MELFGVAAGGKLDVGAAEEHAKQGAKKKASRKQKMKEKKRLKLQERAGGSDDEDLGAAGAWPACYLTAWPLYIPSIVSSPLFRTSLSSSTFWQGRLGLGLGCHLAQVMCSVAQAMASRWTPATSGSRQSLSPTITRWIL